MAAAVERVVLNLFGRGSVYTPFASCFRLYFRVAREREGEDAGKGEQKDEEGERSGEREWEKGKRGRIT